MVRLREDNKPIDETAYNEGSIISKNLEQNIEEATSTTVASELSYTSKLSDYT